MAKVLIKSSKESNLLKFLIQYVNLEKIEYKIVSNLENVEKDVTNIIYIDDEKNFKDLNLSNDIPIILISDEKMVSNCDKLVINYIITDLIHDEIDYTSAQREYLYKKGVYHVLLQKMNELIDNYENYNGLIYDLTQMKRKPEDWIFKFDSINETYNWLISKHRNISKNSVEKHISIYSDKVYDDSVREINYLMNQIMNIKNNKVITEIFILSYEELEIMKKNYFFKQLLKSISANYHIYFVDKEIFKREEELFNQLVDGINIYEDCVYRDTYADELSLGFVDCKKETIEKYNQYFDYILERYGKRLNSEGDIDEF